MKLAGVLKYVTKIALWGAKMTGPSTGEKDPSVDGPRRSRTSLRVGLRLGTVTATETFVHLDIGPGLHLRSITVGGIDVQPSGAQPSGETFCAVHTLAG